MKQQPSAKNRKQNDFELWMQELDGITENSVGVSIYDLPDRDFRTGFDQGLTAQEFFDEEVEANLDDF
jgi:hypothetical protein